MLKLISWNVNGIRACCEKGFRESFERLDADFFCLQETKMQAGQLDLQFEGYQSYWNYAEKKGYSGTAIFTRHQPLSVAYGIGVEEHDHEGRVITGWIEEIGLSHDVGGCFLGLSPKVGRKETGGGVWRLECGSSGNRLEESEE